MRILIIEDDADIAALVRRTLEAASHTVDVTGDGEEGHYLGETEPYDAIVLDLGLPVVNGLEVLERWRADGLETPVLILSARGTWREKVTGLRGGADDYLAKPFEPEELLARIEALIRRSTGNPSPVITCGPIEWDTNSGRILVDGRPVKLTPLEYKMLSYMLHHRNKVISKMEFIDHIYAHDYDRDSNTLEVLIGRLRRKIGEGLIHTHRAQGYRLAVPNDGEEAGADEADEADENP